MAAREFEGSSQSRSLQEAVNNAIDQIAAYHATRPGQDILTTASLESIRFKIGSIAGVDTLVVKFLQDD